MFSVVDCNNFWSPSGGGVRRYHLEKMEFYKNHPDVHYSFIMHDKETWTEQIGESTFIEHLKVPKVAGNWEYRYLIKSGPIEPILTRLNPDAIEVGSPYFLPGIVQKVVRRRGLQSRVFGFWHADFPVTYVKRFLQPFSGAVANVGEQLAWKHARKYYNKMAGTIVSSQIIMDRMLRNGLEKVHFVPLGVDCELFHPAKKDEEIVKKYKQKQDRLLLFFPHRFSKEKGLDVILDAYPLMCERLELAPALVIAGMGPSEGLAKRASEKYEHVHLEGFIDGKERMAQYYASADLGFALSKWETFGLSLLESLSSGLPLIAANDGAAYEHIDRSGAGVVLPEVTPEEVANAVVTYSKSLQQKSLKEKARGYAERLTWEACFEKQLAIYQGKI